MIQQMQAECGKCKGKGKVIRKKCATCGGSGVGKAGGGAVHRHTHAVLAPHKPIPM